ncbi:MAG: DUF169 domain-containing protein [Bryobacteraceae bacterium]|nr:DUF169 domain-containing protein [Bryobacteraceae bacterium]
MENSFPLHAIAIAFTETPPAGLGRWSGAPVPAGCAFWRQALSGQAFYTEPADHYSCAVGAHTHGLSLPDSLGPQLMNTVGFMVSSGYLKMDEVPGIPVLATAPRYISYAPAHLAAFPPDAVLFAGPPATVMLLYEAAVRAGAAGALTPAMGRPGCAILPYAKQSGGAALSFGCRGNRTFTGLADSEMYFALPGAHWPAFAQALDEILAADAKMSAHYQQHQSLFPILS